LGGVYAKLHGPWTLRWTVRNQIIKLVDKMVMPVIAPAWKAMDSAVNALRPKIEPKVRDAIAPIGVAKGELIMKIREAVMSVVEPLLKEHVVPHLAKILVAVQSPMTEAYAASFQLYETEFMPKFEAKGTVDENKPGFRQLDYYPNSSQMWNVARGCDVMYEPLWALNLVFPDIYPWSSIWHAHETIRHTMDNAIYTYETRLLEALEKGEEKDVKALGDRLRSEVLKDYQNDANIHRVNFYRHIIKQIVMPPFEKVVMPVTEAILEPLTSNIPESFNDVLDINQMFNQILVGLIDDSINVVLSSVN